MSGLQHSLPQVHLCRTVCKLEVPAGVLDQGMSSIKELHGC